MPNKLSFSENMKNKYDTNMKMRTCTPPRCSAAARPAAGWGASPHVHMFVIFYFLHIYYLSLPCNLQQAQEAVFPTLMSAAQRAG